MDLGDKLIDFELKDFKGEIHSPRELEDKFVLLILFIASDCPLSRAYLGRLCKLIAKYEEDNLGFILINVNPDIEMHEDMLKCMQDAGLDTGEKSDIVYVLDDHLKVAEQYGAKFTPQAFLFNSNLELVYLGPVDDGGDNPGMVTRVYLEDALEFALDGLDINFPEIKPYGTPIREIKKEKQPK